MENFRVPRREQAVRVVLDDGRTIDAELFVTLFGPDGMPGRVLDRLNDTEEDFLPVRAGGDRFLLNKSGMVTVQIDGEVAEIVPTETAAGRECPVRIGVVGGAGLIGRLLMAMPPERSRAVDYLNAAPRFFPLLGEGQVTLVQKRYVVSVRELEAAVAPESPEAS